MLLQGSVGDLRSGKLSRKDGYIVVAMAFYPRGMEKTLRDEYQAALAPDRELFREWKGYEEKFGHDEAFVRSNYEARFKLDYEAMYKLRRIVERAANQDVYLVCQCAPGERCHREMLLLAAQKKLGAKTGPIHHAYPVFEARLDASVTEGKTEVL